MCMLELEYLWFSCNAVTGSDFRLVSVVTSVCRLHQKEPAQLRIGDCSLGAVYMGCALSICIFEVFQNG